MKKRVIAALCAMALVAVECPIMATAAEKLGGGRKS